MIRWNMQVRNKLIQPGFVMLLACCGVLLWGWAYSPIGNRAKFEENNEFSSDPVAAYYQVIEVLKHPRCINCHPNDNIPKQGLKGRPHNFGITRFVAQQANPALNCQTCHQIDNNPYSGVPGAPHWTLAPSSMGWEGLTDQQIAEAILDPLRNGNRQPDEILTHLTQDPLVLWAWNPGLDVNGIPREPPPISLNEFREAVKLWISNGAPIPE